MVIRAIVSPFRLYHHKQKAIVAATESTSLPFQPISLFLRNQWKPKSNRECNQIHAKLIVSQTISETHVANTLLGLYSKCGQLDQAHHMFVLMPQKNVVSWTTLISAHAHSGSFGKAIGVFKEMLEVGEKPNEYTFSVLLRACAEPAFLALGLQLHGMIVQFGLVRDKFAGISLVYMYFKASNNLDETLVIFDDLLEKDLVTWNVIISGFAEVGDRSVVLRLLSEVRGLGDLKPDDTMVTSVLKCCSSLEDVKQIHCLALKFGTEVNSVVGSALVDLYGKNGDMDSGRKIFDSMDEKDTFVWSSIISGYAKNNKGEVAVGLFRDMSRQGMRLDQHILSSTLKGCAEIEDLHAGTQVHAHMIKNGHQNDCFSGSVLLNIYAGFGRVDDAEKLFRRIKNRDIVAWNSMILAWALLKKGSSPCMHFFQELNRTASLHADGATVIAVLKSCQSKLDLVTGRQIHSVIVRSGISNETLVGNAVIHMYSECGENDDAYKAFIDIVQKDNSSWSSIIGACQQSGRELRALGLSKKMLANGISFSNYSLPSCIAACSELSAVDVGIQLHASVVKYGLDNDVYVGSSIIDMYAKCGSIKEAEKAFVEQLGPNEVSYNALISGYAYHGQAQEAIQVYNKMEKMGLIPTHVTFLAVLSACSHVGYTEESLHFFNMMQDKYKLEPEAEHYSCLVDAYGRAGRLEEAYQLIEKDGKESAWRTLLSACRNYGSPKIAEQSARMMTQLNPDDHAPYVLISSIYSGEGKWDEAHKWRQKMAKVGVKKDPGSSWLL